MSKRSPERSQRGRALSSAKLDAVFGALSHHARRSILVVLHARGGVMSAGEIADRFKHSWPTTTRHLGVLERAGLLEVGKRGRYRFYALRPHVARRAGDWIADWARHTSDEPESRRGDWKKLSFASMRNATPPGRRPSGA